MLFRSLVIVLNGTEGECGSNLSSQIALHLLHRTEIDATQKGLTLRRLMCEAIESALSGESTPKDALRLVQTTLDAM